MPFDYVILGGGLAGLCAAKRLLELGAYPLLIEGGSYPSHKVCGEFISSSGLDILKKWEILLIPIDRMQLHTPFQHLTFNFPTPVGTLSHLTLDPLLAQQISQQGATLRIKTKVQKIFPALSKQQKHVLLLDSGEEIHAKHLLIATGKVSELSVDKPKILYRGFKAHFSHLDLNATLHMFSLPGVYLGLAPIEEGKANLACLAQNKIVQQSINPQQFMQNLIQKHPVLNEILTSGKNLFEEWMEAHIPHFGLRSLPYWTRTYWIGDAAMTIPPACGNGLSLAITSGYLAAEFAIHDDCISFQQMWRKHCHSQIFYGKGLHHIFLNPSLSHPLLALAKYYPFLINTVFKLTRDLFRI